MEVNKIYVGNALEMLKNIPSESVDCVVTSPPYYKQRNYDAGPDEIGQEATPCEYVEKLTDVFRQVNRVLAYHGTLWLNIGDTFHNRSPLGIPWQLAVALQRNGWFLAQEIIWAKPDPMPSGVKCRCVSSHESLFLLAKCGNYYFDREGIREVGQYEKTRNKRDVWVAEGDGWNFARWMVESFAGMTMPAMLGVYNSLGGGDPIPDVWKIPKQSFKGAHFAVMPERLVTPCVQAGCPMEVCTVCGKPRLRIIERNRIATRPGADTKTEGKDGKVTGNRDPQRHVSQITTVGWTDCEHGSYRPGIVLDPFMGAGTVAVVAYEQRRDYLGVELNPDYAKMADRRIKDRKVKYELLEAQNKANSKTLWDGSDGSSQGIPRNAGVPAENISEPQGVPLGCGSSDGA